MIWHLFALKEVHETSLNVWFVQTDAFPVLSEDPHKRRGKPERYSEDGTCPHCMNFSRLYSHKAAELRAWGVDDEANPMKIKYSYYRQSDEGERCLLLSKKVTAHELLRFFKKLCRDFIS